MASLWFESLRLKVYHVRVEPQLQMASDTPRGIPRLERAGKRLPGKTGTMCEPSQGPSLKWLRGRSTAITASIWPKLGVTASPSRMGKPFLMWFMCWEWWTRTKSSRSEAGVGVARNRLNPLSLARWKYGPTLSFVPGDSRARWIFLLVGTYRKIQRAAQVAVIL